MDSLEDELKFTTISNVVAASCWLKKIDDNFLTSEEKFQMVVRTVECPEEYLQLFEEVVKNIQELVQNAFPDFSVRASGFGSFVTGLTLKNCDLDIFIDFQPPTQTSASALKRIKKLLYCKKWQMFERIIYIPANVPILKCEHILKFGCDISVDNAMAQHNSQLIKYYLSMNDRYRDFFLLIKLWSKRCGCSSFTGFKSYAVVLMIIFYLQQRQLIPSVQYLQTLVPARLVNGWNTSFPSRAEKINCVMTVLEMLGGFFKFYATFEFGLYAISPYSGKPILKCEGWKEQLGENNNEMKADGVVCVQDVFQHTFNTSAAITRQTLIDFQTFSTKSAQLCQVQNISVEQIFLINPREKKRNRKKVLLQNERSFTMCVAGPLKGHTEEELRNFWIESTITRMKYVLTEAMLVTMVEESPGEILCQLQHLVSNRQLRIQVSKILQQEDEDYQLKSLLERCVATSSKMRLMPEAKIAQPLTFVTNYDITNNPTRLTVTVNAAEGHTKQANLHNQIQGVAALFYKFLTYIS